MRFRHTALMVGVAAVATLGVSMAGSHAAPSSPDKSKKLKVKKLALTPTKVGGGGGVVRVKVQVTGGTPKSVLAQVRLTGNLGDGATAVLKRSGSNAYSGNVNVMPNPVGRVNKASVVVSATNKSNKATVKIIGYVNVGAGNDSLPPPPPPANFR